MNLQISTMNDMETLQEACRWCSDKIIERAKEDKKISKEALEYNFKRVLAQLEKMNLLK